MTKPTDADVWTKLYTNHVPDGGFLMRWVCTHATDYDRCDDSPAMLLKGDGIYRGVGVCLRHAAKYLGRRT